MKKKTEIIINLSDLKDVLRLWHEDMLEEGVGTYHLDINQLLENIIEIDLTSDEITFK